MNPSISLPSKLFEEIGYFLLEQKEQELTASLKKLRKTKKYGACVRQSARHDDGNVYLEDIPFFEWVMRHAYIKWDADGTLGPAAEQCVRLMVQELGNNVDWNQAFLYLSQREEGAPLMAVLMESGQTFDLADAFVRACRHRNIGPALLLIEHGADPYCLDEEAICIAIKYGDGEFAEQLSAKVDYSMYAEKILNTIRRTRNVSEILIDRFYDFELEHKHRQLAQSSGVRGVIYANRSHNERYEADLLKATMTDKLDGKGHASARSGPSRKI